MSSSSAPLLSVEVAPARTFPLTSVERRFWMLHNLHPDAPVANIGRVVHLRGELFVEDLARAFAVVAQNPVLRLRVREERGEPRGFLGEPPLLTVDTDVADADDVAVAVAEVVKAPYDLARGPLCRARLLRTPDDDVHVLLLGAHHLILDGWGLSRSWPRAIARAMRGENMSFGDEAALDDDTWIDARFKRAPDDPPAEARAADAAWWTAALKDAQVLSLPLVRPPPPRPTGRAWDVEVPVDDAAFARATALAKTVGARPVHVFLAAFVTELARGGRTRDLLLGTTSAARPGNDPDNHEMGCFVRTKALRVAFEDHAPFVDVVKACQKAVRDSLDHPAFDAEELQQIQAPAIGALFNFIPFSAFDGELPGLEVKAGRIIAGGTAFPISMTVDAHGPPRLVVEVDADLFDEGFALRFAERVKAVIDAAVATPAMPWTRLARLGPIDDEARDRNAPTAAETAPVVGGEVTGLIKRDLREGERPALVLVRDPADPKQDVVVSRAALLKTARAIAASLKPASGRHGGELAGGVDDDDLFVGVQCVDPQRTVEAILGVLFAGKAYVPIDPAAPPLRRDAIVEQAKLPLILDDDGVLARGKTAFSDDDDAAAPDPSAAAYAIFTSGSTGAPKGVVISHDALVSQLQAREGLGFPHVDKSCLLAPFFFDGSIETLFWSLTTGGALHLLGEEARRDPTAIRRTLSRRRITYTSAVPALWGAMLDAATSSEEPLDALGFVIVGGEKLTPQLIDKHNAICPRARLVNEYGPTETTVFSSAWTAPPHGEPAPERVPIGRSAPHVRCAVVDDNLEPVPCLEAGELVVSGPGLADGYLNAPELTAAAFVVHEGVRLYKTGDLVRLWPDGDLEWLARKDDQVKLRGVRVEPGEVEAALLAEGCAEAAVLVDGQHLVAWVSPASCDEAALIIALQRRLPEAMVPSRIVAMALLPKTANDKIDKRNLPKVAVDDVVVPPANDLERTIAGIWQDVLSLPVPSPGGLAGISVTKSFFAYGGHSLKAAVVVRRLSDHLGREVPLSALMFARTVRELARTLDPQAQSGARSSSSSSSSTLLLPLSAKAVSAPRVVFLPGIGGHVFTFAGIADRMSTVAAGLRSYGSEPGEEPLSSVEELARKNLEELDRCNVADDVVFAGYSFGGLVAYEMALQRAALGRPPRHVVIFDTMAPGYPKKLPLHTRARLHAESLVRADWEGRRAYIQGRVDSIKEKLNFRLQRADAFKDAFALDDDELRALGPVQRAQLEKLAGTSTLAHHRYWPRASVSVPMTLFVAESGFDWAATVMDDPLLGWRAWGTGPLRRVALKGDHLRLFVEENLETAAKGLDSLA
ncbi:MAG: amino acid adenylation domain-containing protein [Deltaproteobacteria bacterium]|nr:amino acid adenylation domain-containing protein [Deltaproteobacteria bacterium]